MNEQFFQQLVAEMIEAQSQALALIVSAVARQIDPEQLSSDLKAQLRALQTDPKWPTLATRIATPSLAAADAETLLRNRSSH